MAKFTEYISNLFRSSGNDEDQYYDDEQISDPASTANTPEPTPEQKSPVQRAVEPPQVTPSYQPAQLPRLKNAEVEIPYWLEDEDTLRDEGVLFGLSESDPTEKTDIIQKYFSQLAAEPVSYLEQHNERIQELSAKAGFKDSRIKKKLPMHIKTHNPSPISVLGK